MNFDDIEWHDQIFVGIKIDRRNPGKNDSIEIEVLIDNNKMIVLFQDVYFADVKMNFGIYAEESIRYAIINGNDDEIPKIQEKWGNVGAVLDKLTCFEFNTNSTNSLIKIYALSYEISNPRCPQA